MVRKLIKKEFRESYKIFLPIHLLLVTVSLLNYIASLQYRRLGDQFTGAGVPAEAWEKISFVVGNITIILFLGIVILSLFASITYLYKNIYNEKGYELFTLPAKTWEIMLSKILVVILWIVSLILTFVIATLISDSILREDVMIRNLKTFVSNITNSQAQFAFFRAYLNFIILFLSMITTVLFAGALAHSKYVQKGRGAVTFIIIFIMGIIVFNVLLNLNYNFDWMMNWEGLTTFEREFHYVFSYVPTNSRLLIEFLWRGSLLAITSIGTHYLWKHKLQI